MISCSYFLSYACAETLENGIIEFDTYGEAFSDYAARKISGYSVVIHEMDFQGALAKEIRKGASYEDRRPETTTA
jgi:hypothetical protein